MSDYLECAGGDIIRDEHRSTCTDDGCRGCLPKPAQWGCLCTAHWYRLVDAITEWSVLERHLDENAVLSPRESGLSRSPAGPRLPLPQTFLAADEVRSWLRSYTGDARSWVSTVQGAQDAVRFTKAVESAARTHVIEEKPRQVVRMRCPNPLHGAYPPLVTWYPPAAQFELMEVKCDCGWHADEETQWKAWRRTYDGWEAYKQPAIDAIAEIESGRKSVMSVIDEGKTA